MQQLTLEHIAPYLPYGLQCIYEGTRQELVSLHYFYSRDEDGENAGKSECTEVYHPRFNRVRSLISAIKPVLRPFSDIKKEIEHNGEKFVPIDVLQKQFFVKEIDFFENKIGIYMQKIGYTTKPSPYFVYQKLFEWHFDIFSLIDNGLAIDYNAALRSC